MSNKLGRAVGALLSAIGLVFSVPVVQAAETAGEFGEYSQQQLLDAGLEVEDLEGFATYLEEIEYINSDDYEMLVYRDRSIGNAKASDLRVGLLVMGNATTFRANTSSTSCTANKISKYLWITAKHCVLGRENNIGFIKRELGHHGGIAEIIIPPGDGHDLALIRIDGGLDFDNSFIISDREPTTKDDMMANGYSGPDPKWRDYPTWAHVRYTGEKRDVTYSSGFQAKGLLVVKGQDAEENRKRNRGEEPNGICKGDSGTSMRGHGANERYIYGILSGGSLDLHNGRCTVSRMYFSPVAPHKEFIDDQIRETGYAELQQRVRAYYGRQLYFRSFGIGGNPEIPRDLRPIVRP
ncbi:MAG: trypsin-like serine protease [Corynebacterium sp.]|nr:trypsin-like serine protease [Corynebacterium sp.]